MTTAVIDVIRCEDKLVVEQVDLICLSLTGIGGGSDIPRRKSSFCGDPRSQTLCGSLLYLLAREVCLGGRESEMRREGILVTGRGVKIGIYMCMQYMK